MLSYIELHITLFTFTFTQNIGIINIINKILVYLNFQEMASFTSNGNISVIQMLRGRQKHDKKNLFC